MLRDPAGVSCAGRLPPMRTLPIGVRSTLNETLAVRLAGDGVIAWLGVVLLVAQVLGAYVDGYVALTVARSASGTCWADTQGAFIAARRLGDGALST